ncbi:Uncharacterised protein [Collinsella intestinalis]|nr:Uncharacterised protein [Collinsella intestinalis]
MATITRAAKATKIRPMPSPRLKAAPLFATKRKLKIPGITETLSPVTMRVFFTNTFVT